MNKKSIAAAILAVSASALGCVAFAACDGNDGAGGNDSKTVVSISLNMTNAKTVFNLGDDFSTVGVGVEITYDDNSTGVVFGEDCEIVVPDMTTRGTKGVTLTYGGQTVEYSVTVRELEAIYVDVTSEAVTTFELGDEFVSGGVDVWAKFYDIEDGEKLEEGQYTVGGCDTSVRGKQSVTVSYLGKTAEYDVIIKSSPTLLTATAVKETDGVYIELTGTVLPEAGYGADEFSLDFQPLNRDTRIDVPVTGVTFDNGGVRFTVRGKVDGGTIDGEIKHLVHLFLGKDDDKVQYDVVDLGTDADATVQLDANNSLIVRSEAVFSDNTSKFLTVLKSDGIVRTMTPTGVDLIEEDGKIYLVVTGSGTGLSENSISLDIRSDHFGEYTLPLTTKITFDGDEFTAKGELPLDDDYINGTRSIVDASVNVYMYLHLTCAVAGFDDELYNKDGDMTITASEKTVSVADGGFRFVPIKLFDDKILMTVQKLSPLELKTIDVKVEDGEKYLVVTGSVVGVSSVSDLSFDFQANWGSWDYAKGLPAPEITLEGADFTIVQNISDLAAGTYFSHVIVKGSGFDAVLPQVVAPKTVENMTVEAKDIFGNGAYNLYLTIA